MTTRTKYGAHFPPKHRWFRATTPISGGRSIRHIWRILRLVKTAAMRAFAHDAFTIAKASAYSCILTFFPALLVLGAVLASSGRFEIYIREISGVLGQWLPVGGSVAIGYLRSSTDHPVGFLTSTSLFTVWAGSGVVTSWMEGFRRAYEIPPSWGLLKERGIACSLVILAGFPMTIATVLVAFGSQIETRAVLDMGNHLGPVILLMWAGLRWLLAILTSIAVIALIYHNAVPRTHHWLCVLPGAGLVTPLWFAATLGFGWYMRRSAEYSLIYGSLAVSIALLVWMFLISFIVLIGAEFNALLFPRRIAPRSLAIETSRAREAA